MANKSCLSVALQQQQWGALAQKMQMQKSEHKRLYIELVLYHHLIAAERKWFRGDELKCPRMWHHIQYTPYIIPIRAGSEIWLPSFIFPRCLEGSFFFLILPYNTLFSLFSSRFAIGDKPKGKQPCPTAGPHPSSSAFLISRQEMHAPDVVKMATTTSGGRNSRKYVNLPAK